MSALPADRGPPNSAPAAGAEASQPTNRGRRGRGRRRNSPHRDTSNNAANPGPQSAAGGVGRRRNKGPQERLGPTDGDGRQLPPHVDNSNLEDGASVAESTGSNSRPNRGRGRGRGRGNPNANRGGANGRGGRRQQFGARLTEGTRATAPVSEPTPPPPTSGDLTSRLIYSLTHKEDAVDCPICFNPVHPTQPIWSCAPSPVDPLDDPSAAPATCCWTIFHMKCIKEWARKSVTATREAYRARDVDLPGDWRCPGCQTKRTEVPRAYVCFCGRASDPPPSRLSTPHSCGCEKHTCQQECHPGPCSPCQIVDTARCYCGKHEKEMSCGAGSPMDCGVEGMEPWEGRWQCEDPCGFLIAGNINARSHAVNCTQSAGMLAPMSVTLDLVPPARCPLMSSVDAAKRPHESLVTKFLMALRSSVREHAKQCEGVAGMYATEFVVLLPEQQANSRVNEESVTKSLAAVTITVCFLTIAARALDAFSRPLNRSCVPAIALSSSLRFLVARISTALTRVLSHHRRVAIRVRHIHATSALFVTCDALRSVHRVVLLAENCSTADTTVAIEHAILANVGHAHRFAGNPGKRVGTLVLSLVMPPQPAHRSILLLAPLSLPRLADALGISESSRSASHNQVTWDPDLVVFGRVPANQAFVKNVEKALADFVGSDKKAHVLPYMPEARRKILVEVAEVYRINTQLVDEEPRRSVQLIRRVDSRIPTPLLSQASTPAPSRLGSLGDLRKPATVIKSTPASGSVAPAWRSGTASPGVAASNARSGSPAQSSGPPTSALGSSATPWTRSGASVTPRATPPPAMLRTGSSSFNGGNMSSGRQDVPTNWEDE
ncbi:FKBP12-associated protein [Ceratobasidium theobromae]|uniref:FKBP12-associated protein n=1 Tax=Ceratobasidium theobromae TaxID=1582974 RepID=A0A5N5QRX7_9AGAM|nr:FKBP12-associated protein [Ceratobasidium theobromae]